jgi:hypothetical protein
MSLYDVSKDIELIVQEVMDAEGVLSSELETRLDFLSLSFKDKVGNIGRWILNIEANEPGLDNEIKRLQKRLKTQINMKERLAKYLKFCMETANLNKVELDNLTVSLDKNPPSVEIEDEKELPARYVKIEQITTIDKKQISCDLKAGKVVSGAHLVTDRTHLKIR